MAGKRLDSFEMRALEKLTRDFVDEMMPKWKMQKAGSSASTQLLVNIEGNRVRAEVYAVGAAIMEKLEVLEERTKR